MYVQTAAEVPVPKPLDPAPGFFANDDETGELDGTSDQDLAEDEFVAEREHFASARLSEIVQRRQQNLKWVVRILSIAGTLVIYIVVVKFFFSDTVETTSASDPLPTGSRAEPDPTTAAQPLAEPAATPTEQAEAAETTDAVEADPLPTEAQQSGDDDFAASVPAGGASGVTTARPKARKKPPTARFPMPRAE
jgi:cytoskeletal protein RodZ